MSKAPPEESADHTRAGWRIVLLVLLAFAEFAAIDAHNLRVSEACKPYLFYAVQATHFGLLFAAGLMVAMLPSLRGLWRELCAAAQHHHWKRYLCAQLLVFALFYVCSDAFFASLEACAVSSVTLIAWIFLAAATLLLFIACLADYRFWFSFLSRLRLAMLLSALVAAVVTVAARLTQGLWGSLAELTFHVSARLLTLMYPDEMIYADVNDKILGTDEFRVNIAPDCSGYEGIGLIIGFLTLYLSLYRAELRFPRALLLYPIGISAIWLFNALRITVLIAIGDSWSPEIALGGFHSQAGWISFIAIALGLIALIHNAQFFVRNKPPVAQVAREHEPLSTAMLLPIVVLLAVTLVSGAFSAGFDWLYPLRVLATGAALLCFWRVLELRSYRPAWEPVLAGIVVFGLWLLTVPRNPDADAAFSLALAESVPAITIGWLLLRSIGSIITVPLAEELAFRGYMLSKLCGREAAMNDKLPLNWFAIAGSSLAFGLLHGAWMAGTLAGFLYAWARYRRGRVLDAVLAHMVTNALVTIYVLLTSQWVYW